MISYFLFGLIAVCIIAYGIYIIRKRKISDKDAENPHMDDAGLHDMD